MSTGDAGTLLLYACGARHRSACPVAGHQSSGTHTKHQISTPARMTRFLEVCAPWFLA